MSEAGDGARNELTEVAEALAEVEAPVAEVLAGIVDGEFGLEMISPWGDRWIWVDVGAETAQEIYKTLGEPVTFQQVEHEDRAESAGEDDLR